MDKKKIHQEVLDKQKILEESIKNGDHEAVLVDFNSYLDSFVLIGHYNHSTWDVSWTRKCWEFFTELSRYDYSPSFIGVVDDRLLT
ncbi:hypothetical protein, partial [Vibrio vulnificus]